MSYQGSNPGELKSPRVEAKTVAGEPGAVMTVVSPTAQGQARAAADAPLAAPAREAIPFAAAGGLGERPDFISPRPRFVGRPAERAAPSASAAAVPQQQREGEGPSPH